MTKRKRSRTQFKTKGKKITFGVGGATPSEMTVNPHPLRMFDNDVVSPAVLKGKVVK